MTNIRNAERPVVCRLGRPFLFGDSKVKQAIFRFVALLAPFCLLSARLSSCSILRLPSDLPVFFSVLLYCLSGLRERTIGL